MEKLAIGVVGRAHGVKGFFKVKSFSGETAHFLSLKEIHLHKGNEDVGFVVETCRDLGSGVLLKLRGIDSPEAAAKYSLWEILVPRDKACPLGENEFYIADLCGCSVVTGDRVVGKVRSVLEGVTSDLLEVVDEKGRSYIVPFVDEHVGTVDLLGKTLELKSKWLLE
jgi:16S rRNA processing protein RimM